MRSYMGSYLENIGLEELLPKISVHTDEFNKVTFGYAPYGNQVRFDSLPDAVNAVKFDHRTKMTRNYSLSNPYYAGGGTNPFIADFEAAFPQHEVRVRSYQLEDSADTAWLDSVTKGPNGESYGLTTFGGDGGVQILDVVSPDGKLKTFDEIMSGMGLNATNQGSVLKRMKILTNDRTLFNRYDLSEKADVYLFDPEKVFGSNPEYEAFARAKATMEATTPDEIPARMRKIYESMSDGALFQTARSMQEDMVGNIRRAKLMKYDAQTEMALTTSASRRAELQQQIRSADMIIEEAQKQMRFGRISNTRLHNVTDVVTADSVAHLKGNQSIINSDMARRLIQLDGGDSSIDVDRLIAIGSQADEKSELFGGLSRVKTSELHGAAQSVRSDILTLSINRDMIGTPQSLAGAARSEIAEGIESLRAGRISPKLMQIVNDLENWEPLPTDGLAAQTEAFNGRKFARQIKRQIEMGSNISEDPVLMAQMHRALVSHYTRYRKGKFEKTVQFGGQSVPYLDMSFPIPNSTRAEVVADLGGIFNGQRMRYNTISKSANAVHLDAITWSNSISALGGADLDDNLANILKYDSKARRLVSFSYRNPAQMGEFMIYDADISMDTKAPEAIKKMWQRQQQLINEVAISKKGLAAKFEEINQIREALHAYYMGRADLDKVDLFQKISGKLPDIFAPKGFKRITKGSTYKSALAQSFNVIQSNETNEAAVAKRIARELKENGLTGRGQLFKYVGNGYDEFHNELGLFQKSQAIESLVENLGKAPLEKLSPHDIALRMDMELKARGLLGREVNLDSVISSTIQSTLKHGTRAEQEALLAEIRRNPFTFIETELVVDTIKKTGSAELTDLIAGAVSSDVEKLGSIIGSLHGKGFTGIGLDPIDVATRLANPETQAALRSGYAAGRGIELGEVGEKFLLAADSPKAFASQVFKEQLSLIDDFAESTLPQEALDKLAASFQSMIFTPDEISNAQNILEKIGEASKMQEALDSASSLEETEKLLKEALEGGLDFDDPNTAAMRMLHGLGLETPEALDRQVLAMANILTTNAQASGNYNLLRAMQIEGDMGSLSVANLYQGAMRRQVYSPQALDEISQISGYKGLRKFINSDGFTTASEAIYDPMMRNRALMSKVLELRQDPKFSSRTHGELKRHAQAIMEDMSRRMSESGMSPDEFLGYEDRVYKILNGEADNVIPAFPTFTSARIPGVNEQTVPGLRHFRQREVADTVADAVVEYGSEYKPMTSLNMDMLKKLWAEPMFKKGIVGFGVLAGFGLVHRMIKDPTPEDIQGPPLLPGGSPYEDYNPSSYQDVQSMYPAAQNSAAMLYTIQASGRYEPATLSSDISQITNGNVTTRTYNSRQTLTGRPSARELLSTMMSGE